MWAIEVVMAKHSFRSCDTKPELFSSMFPDSKIAQKFACAETKCKYPVCNGIAPYFKELLNMSSAEVEHYICLFDASFYDLIKNEKMDLHVRFWDSSQNAALKRYYNSQILGNAES